MNLRLLIITRNAWSNEISTGNTMTNFFSGWKYDIANIFCRDEKINNTICKKYFRITERELIDSIVRKNDNVGKKITYQDYNLMRTDQSNNTNINNEKKKYDFFKKHRLVLFLWFRELIWKIGKWKNCRLENFLHEFNPNIILIPLYDCWYMYDIAEYIYKYTNSKVIIYTGDDMYSLKQFSISPLFWINRIVRRKKIQKLINVSNLRLCLTEKQAMEYSRLFDMDFVVSMKSSDCNININKNNNESIQMVYTGNIFPGRHKTLIKIAKAVDEINEKMLKCQLHIYTANKLSKRILKKFNCKGVVFHGGVSSEEVDDIQRAADILIYVEDFSYKNRLKVRLSLSTKIVDYLSKGKCILSVAPKDIASTEYLLENRAAAVVTDKKEIRNTILSLICDKKKIKYYENQAVLCCEKNHDKNKLQDRLYKRIESIVV